MNSEGVLQDEDVDEQALVDPRDVELIGDVDEIMQQFIRGLEEELTRSLLSSDDKQ
jgi:hypothetical protein